MKRFILGLVALGICSLGLTGCAEKTESKTERTISTPGGTTKITEEKEVKKTGDNPP